MATKKKTTRKSGASKRTTAQRTATKHSVKEQQAARQQIYALILLAVSILIFCLSVIKGEFLWTWLHNVLLGTFSFSACILPVLMAFVSIMLALEKDVANIRTRVWQTAVFALLLNSSIYSCTVSSAGYGFFDAVNLCFERGQSYRGSGVFGVILGLIAIILSGLGDKINIQKSKKQ